MLIGKCTTNEFYRKSISRREYNNIFHYLEKKKKKKKTFLDFSQGAMRLW